MRSVRACGLVMGAMLLGGSPAEALPAQAGSMSSAQVCRVAHSTGYCFVTEHLRGIQVNRRLAMHQFHRLGMQPTVRITGKLSWNAYRLHRELRTLHTTVVKLKAKATPQRAPSVDWAKWMPIYNCENGDYGWHANTGNTFYGGLQIMLSTWASNGGLRYASRPDLASPEQQIMVAEAILASSGWGAWPTCAHNAGYW